jgi:glucose-1-phosphate thymidylyltransferase
MLHLAEFDPDRAALGMAGVSLYGAGALRLVATAAGHGSNDLDLTLAASKIAAAGGTMNVILADSWRRYAGDPLDLLELNRIALDRLDSDQNRTHSNGNRIEGHVKIDERASVFASVIVGPAVIGAGAQIVDAYIGPYTSVGSDARIEGTEIERSIVSAGASIMHVGGRLAASVIGRNSRVFRDFSVPRALRLRIGDGTEVALC